MDFDTLKNKIYRKKAEFDYNLAHCHDVYRLAHLMNIHIRELDILKADADEMVSELERI